MAYTWLKWWLTIRSGYCFIFHLLLGCKLSSYSITNDEFIVYVALSQVYFWWHNFHSRYIWYEKPVLITSARKWSQFMVPVFGSSVTGLTYVTTGTQQWQYNIKNHTNEQQTHSSLVIMTNYSTTFLFIHVSTSVIKQYGVIFCNLEDAHNYGLDS